MRTRGGSPPPEAISDLPERRLHGCEHDEIARYKPAGRREVALEVLDDAVDREASALKGGVDVLGEPGDRVGVRARLEAREIGIRGKVDIDAADRRIAKPR